MTSIREQFVKQAIRILRREGFKQKTLEWVLAACWSHGASTAFYLPPLADKALKQGDRVAFASALIDRVGRDLLKSSGFTRKEIETVVADLVQTEECLPETRLSAEIDDWLVGRRSQN